MPSSASHGTPRPVEAEEVDGGETPDETEAAEGTVPTETEGEQPAAE